MRSWITIRMRLADTDVGSICNREQFDVLIGAYAGIVVSDRWNGLTRMSAI